jgi:dipeptidyl aminopeptidase/acylaminoacyl peptidase
MELEPDDDYPPVMLLHSDANTDVPVQKCIDMAQACQRQGVEYVLRVLPGCGHGFDNAGAGGQDPVLAQLFGKVLASMRRYVTPG